MLIIYPPTVHWDFMMARPQQLMSAFSHQGDKVIFCEPGNHTEPKVIKIKEGLWLNYGASIDQWPAECIHESKKILWVSYPANVSLIGEYREDLVIYDILDYPDDDFVAWKPYVQELLSKCHVVLTVSRPLLDHFKKFHPKVYLVRNGVDYDFFATTVTQEIPKELKQIAKPLVGFYGALAPWIDWSLVEELAARNPAVSFVFIGPTIAMKTEDLPKQKNIYFLGHKPYGELPAYAVNFDVCIFPFKKTRMTSYVNPVKIYEYLAMGKPVVATDLPEVMDMLPHIYAAENIEKFQSNLLKCLTQSDNHLIEARKSFARENTWEKRVRQIRKIIQSD